MPLSHRLSSVVILLALLMLSACAQAGPTPNPSPLPPRSAGEGNSSGGAATELESSAILSEQSTEFEPIEQSDPKARAPLAESEARGELGALSGNGIGPLAEVDASPVVRLRIPKIGVDSTVVTLGLDKDGAMQTPDRPDIVAWYAFSPLPGSSGNAVFSGHLDWRTGETGVFWKLKELEPGDIVYVRAQSGDEQAFVVEWGENYDEQAAPLGRILGPTSTPAITLITCEGTFDPVTRSYDGRRVVRAVKAST